MTQRNAALKICATPSLANDVHVRYTPHSDEESAEERQGV